MRRKFCGGFAALSITLLLMSGCAKDQVKPDEGIASEKPAQSQPTAQQLAEQQAALRDRLAREFTASERRVSASRSTLAFLRQQVDIWSARSR